ncbi:MAG TPA: CBS domain-containing protein [Dehalococcoidales bacterium]|nr:CBS domain-containing protein [Dehalococcoidales bacterium]
MRISDVMTTNVISIPSSTTLAEARKIMDIHHYRRLPVIDRGKLVGIVTKDGLDKMGPSKLSSLDLHELAYMVNTIKVKEVMHKEVVTAPSDTYIDDAIALVQDKRVGMLIVVDDGTVVGVATTQDIFYKIVNPVFGVKIPGRRIYVENCAEGADIEKVMGAIKDNKMIITAQFSAILPEFNRKSLVIQLQGENYAKCIDAIKKMGYNIIEKI